MHTLISKKVLNVAIPVVGTLAILTMIATQRSRMISAAEYEQPIYTENVIQGWSLKPVSVSVNVAFKGEAFQGKTSLELKAQDSGEVVFASDHLLDVTKTNTFSFAAKSDALRYQVTIAGLNQNGQLLNDPITLSSHNHSNTTESGWRIFEVNTEDFIGGNAMISAVSLTFSFAGNAGQSTVLLDDVQFIDAYRERISSNSLPVLDKELTKDWTPRGDNAKVEVVSNNQKSELAFTPNKFGSVTLEFKDEVKTKDWPFLKLSMRISDATQRYIMTFNSSQGEEYTYFFNPVHTLTVGQDTTVIVPLAKAPAEIKSFSIKEMNGTNGKDSFISDIAFIKGDN